MDLLRNLSHFDISCEELKEKIERHFSINLKKLEFFEQQIEDLLMKHKTSEIKGFKSKAGKSFNAILELKTDFTVGFIFK